MSYTILSTPPALSSVHDDLIYTVAYPEHTSNPTTYENYKFVADIYINGVMKARLKKVPNPDTSIGVFNIGQIVRNYLNVTFNPSSAAFLAQEMTTGECNVSVQVKFGEEYGFDTYTNVVSDTERVFFNNYNGRLIGVTTSLNGLGNKVISTRPQETTIHCLNDFNLIPFFGQTSGTKDVEIKTYDYSNNLVDTQTLSLVIAADNNYGITNCSKSGINSLVPGLINDTIKYYTAQYNSGVIYRFNIDCDCRYENFTLHFLNKYGGFESKDFNKVSRKTINIERKDFGRLAYTIGASGEVSYYNSNNVYNEQMPVYSSQYKEKMTLNSDFLTDAEYRWLQELIVSPIVYMEQEGYFIQVRITDNDYEPKKRINDELTNLTLSIEFGTTHNTQYR